MRKYGYLVVEGPHDVEFVYRLLSTFGLSRVQWGKDLDAKMVPLIPISFPPQGDLLKSMPVPLFTQSQTHAIAIHSATGDSRLVATLEENRTILSFSDLTGVGLLLDSDLEIAPLSRYETICGLMKSKELVLPEKPGLVLNGKPRMGAFILPDNINQGSLEDVLLECAASAYPHVLQHATQYVTNASHQALADGKDLSKPALRKKAIVGSIATVLRPGRAVQVSIQDNAWLRDQNLKLPRVDAVLSFLAELFELG